MRANVDILHSAMVKRHLAAVINGRRGPLAKRLRRISDEKMDQDRQQPPKISTDRSDRENIVVTLVTSFVAQENRALVQRVRMLEKELADERAAIAGAMEAFTEDRIVQENRRLRTRIRRIVRDGNRFKEYIRRNHRHAYDEARGFVYAHVAIDSTESDDESTDDMLSE